MTNDKFRQEAVVKYPISIGHGRIVYQEGKRIGWVEAREFSAAELEEKDRQIEQLRDEVEKLKLENQRLCVYLGIVAT